MSAASLVGLGFLGAAAAALGGALVRPLLARAGLREPTEKTDAPEVARRHAPKRGTPTAGGVVFLLAALPPLALTGALAAPPVRVVLVLVVALAALGLRDDWVKARDRARRGVGRRTKLWLPFLLGVGAAAELLRLHGDGCPQHLPFTATTVALGLGGLPLGGLVVAATANAVNLTDGLDGLAAGLAAPALGVLGVLAALQGETALAQTAAVLGGAALGFLLWNRHPARLFMGDTGSLALGGGLGGLALALHETLLLVLLGGVFVAEALSVLVQVWSCRRYGRRVFRCAPLHHHFEYLDWPEPRITRWFWAAGWGCAAVALLGGL